MWKDGNTHGFGIWYTDLWINIGWWKNGTCVGNYIDLNRKDLSLFREGFR